MDTEGASDLAGQQNLLALLTDSEPNRVKKENLFIPLLRLLRISGPLAFSLIGFCMKVISPVIVKQRPPPPPPIHSF